MKRIASLLIIIVTVLNIYGADKKSNINVGKQLFSNLNIGWDVTRTSDYRWRNFRVGTGYGQRFDFDPKASWQLGINYNWNKFTLYRDGDLSMGGLEDSKLRNQSLSFPLIANYEVHKSFFSGVNVYTGPIYEVVLKTTLDRAPFDNYNATQFGWTVGTKIRFLVILSARLAYTYYPISILSDHNFDRSAVSFSLGF